MKLWIPKEKVANRLKLQIISSLHYFSSLPLSQTANFFYTENPSKTGQRDHTLLHHDLQKEGNVHCFVNMLSPEIHFHCSIKSRLIRIVFLLSWCSGREWFSRPINNSFKWKLLWCPANMSFQTWATLHYLKVLQKFSKCSMPQEIYLCKTNPLPVVLKAVAFQTKWVNARLNDDC